MKPINSVQFSLQSSSDKFSVWLHTETANISTFNFQMPYGGAIEIQKPELDRYRARTVCRYHAIREVTLDSAVSSYSDEEDSLDGETVVFGTDNELTGILTKNVFTFIIYPEDQIGHLKVRAQCWCDCAFSGFSHILKSIADKFPKTAQTIEKHHETFRQ